MQEDFPDAARWLAREWKENKRGDGDVVVKRARKYVGTRQKSTKNRGNLPGDYS